MNVAYVTSGNDSGRLFCMKKSFGERLKEWKDSRGISGYFINFRMSVSNVETGQRPPTPLFMERLASPRRAAPRPASPCLAAPCPARPSRATPG